MNYTDLRVFEYRMALARKVISTTFRAQAMRQSAVLLQRSGVHGIWTYVLLLVLWS